MAFWPHIPYMYRICALRKNVAVILSFAVAVVALYSCAPTPVFAHHMEALLEGDSDFDGLKDDGERAIYGTDPMLSDTDGDGFLDGDEVSHGYDPLEQGGVRLAKRIIVDLSEQRLTYSYGAFGEQGNFLISSGTRWTPSPKGEFDVIAKLPLVNYSGRGYYYPRTKWNLRFKPGYYIHGAWWHNNFGTPMSHGCINVSYANMERLYAFADEGTDIIIRE